MMAPEPGIARLIASLADRYAIERELGTGGMATVYLARDLRHDRHVALKVLRPELGAVLGGERFLAEIRITAQLQHPHILTLIDSGKTEGLLWYSLPYVGGETLHDRLAREGQLSIAETIRIARQVASALDFAHARGVIHRDVKPQNILLFEGEAMLADFGIALAVREAGGDRLTQTGLSLGTPEYMSPEQASGDRRLDARTDVYSLGAVVYEMLAGDPPFSGRNAQAIIAKLMTETPTRLRAIRSTVSPATDDAVARALSKVPADRFESAGAFTQALDGAATMGAGGGRRRIRRWALGAVGLGALVVTAAIWASTRANTPTGLLPVFDHRQITFVGGAFAPALSPDGSRVAFAVRRCDSSCTIEVQIQDVDGGAPLTLLRGVPGIFSLEWSPSSRHLLALGTIEGHYGSHLIPTLGGGSAFLGCCWATFWPRGDSIIVVRGSFDEDSTTAAFATLDGVMRDSIRLPSHAWVAAPLHGGALLGVGRLFRDAIQFETIDHGGNRLDSLRMPVGQEGMMGGHAGAMYFVRAETRGASVETHRWHVDSEGRFSSPDTFAIDVGRHPFWIPRPIADGRFAFSRGPDERALWVVPMKEALRPALKPASRVAHSTAFLQGQISPDGQWILVTRPAARQGMQRVTVVPTAGGAEIRVAEGEITAQGWSPDGDILLAEAASSGTSVTRFEIASRTRRQLAVVPDGGVGDIALLGDGTLLWVPGDHRPFRLAQPGQSPRSLDLPPWIVTIVGFDVSPDGTQLVVSGWIPGFDTIAVATVRLDEGSWTREWKAVAEYATVRWLRDGSVLVFSNATRLATEVYRLRPGGATQRLGILPGLTVGADASRDGSRILVTTSEFRGDVWIARLGTPR